MLCLLRVATGATVSNNEYVWKYEVQKAKDGKTEEWWGNHSVEKSKKRSQILKNINGFSWESTFSFSGNIFQFFLLLLDIFLHCAKLITLKKRETEGAIRWRWTKSKLKDANRPSVSMQLLTSSLFLLPPQSWRLQITNEKIFFSDDE